MSQFYDFPTLKQLLFFPAAVGIFLVMRRVDYRRFDFRRVKWRSLTPYLLGLSIVCLILVLIFGVERN